MTYDFTSIMDRLGKDAIAVDCPAANGKGHRNSPTAPKEGFDVIPMWIADMNFATVPTIPAAIIARFGLRRPIYSPVAAYGHMGREDVDAPWEHTDLAQALADALSV